MRARKILNGRVTIRRSACPICGSCEPHSVDQCLPSELNPRYWRSAEEGEWTLYGKRDEYGGL